MARQGRRGGQAVSNGRAESQRQGAEPTSGVVAAAAAAGGISSELSTCARAPTCSQTWPLGTVTVRPKPSLVLLGMYTAQQEQQLQQGC
jgi:hypothetical protein